MLHQALVSQVRHQKYKQQKKKIDKLDFIKMFVFQRTLCERTIHKIGENICKSCNQSVRDLYPQYIKNSHNSTIKRQISNFKNGQIIRRNISPKKIYKWQQHLKRFSKSFVIQFSSLSRVWLFATSWTAARQAPLSITNSRSSPKPMSTELVMPSNHLILCRPLLPPSTFPSIRVLSNKSALPIRWPMYWSFSFNISPSNECSGLISFRMDWLDLLAVQGTLKSLFPTPQFKSIDSSALSFLYSPTLTSIHDHWKNHSLD